MIIYFFIHFVNNNYVMIINLIKINHYFEQRNFLLNVDPFFILNLFIKKINFNFLKMINFYRFFLNFQSIFN